MSKNKKSQNTENSNSNIKSLNSKESIENQLKIKATIENQSIVNGIQIIRTRKNINNIEGNNKSTEKIINETKKEKPSNQINKIEGSDFIDVNQKRHRKKKSKKTNSKKKEENENFPCLSSSSLSSSLSEKQKDAKKIKENNVLTDVPKTEETISILKNLCNGEFKIKFEDRFYEQGIKNLGNTCYLGSALQLLLSSRGFCYLLENFKKMKKILNPEKLPTLIALGELAAKLTLINKNEEKNTLKYELCPITPIMLNPVLEEFKNINKANKQIISGEQDAQEFLLFLISKMENEISEIKKEFLGNENHDYSQPEEKEEEGWLTVGKKQKVSVTRNTGIYHNSLLSSIFLGTLQGIVTAKAMKYPSVTTHQFTILNLDIAKERILRIEDAINSFTSKDLIQEYRIEASNIVTMAEKANLFKELPQCLIISLKKYAYRQNGMIKLDKNIIFDDELIINSKWMVDKNRDYKYKLMATCSHHGLGHGGDHYTANVLLLNGKWVHYNDSKLEMISWDDVRDDQPYLLLYERV